MDSNKVKEKKIKTDAADKVRHPIGVKLIAIIVIISFTSRLIGGITFNYLEHNDNPATMFYWNALFGVIL